MRRISAFFIILALLLACSPRIVTVAVHDTLTITRTEVLRDTIVSIRLPEETAVRETRDTLSQLETTYARATRPSPEECCAIPSKTSPRR